MGAIRKFLNRYPVKLTLTLMLCMVIVLLLTNFLIYQFTLRAQFNLVRERLKLIAQTSALMVDPETLQAIPLNKEGIHSEAYKKVLLPLLKIKNIDPYIKYFFITQKTNKPGIVQFIIDVDTIPEELQGKIPPPRRSDDTPLSYPGDLYNAGRFPQMMKGYDAPAADWELTRDEWGVLLSGYAPIYNSAGQPIAQLGVDFSVEDLAAIQAGYRERMRLVLVLGLMIAAILGFTGPRPLTMPIEVLVAGIRRITRGDLQYRIKLNSTDEMGEVASAFNQMSRSLYHTRRKTLAYFHRIVSSLVRVLEARDPYTQGHSKAVANYATRIALKLGLPREQVKVFKKITILHDIGKVGIEDKILNKPGALTPEEWEKIRAHPIIGEKILRPVLKDERMLHAVRGHHERYDGTGYPDRLKGDDINIFAAIVSVADAFHAMTSDRAYRKSLPVNEAVAELKRNRGTQFHPRVVDAFLQILEEDKKRTA